MRSRRPTLWGLDDLGKPMIHFSIEPNGRIRTAIQVPIERRIVFRGSLVMQIDSIIAHGN